MSGVEPVTPEALARLPIFRRVSPQDRQRIVELSRIRAYERGDSIFHEGDQSDFFLVVTGRAKIFKRSPSGKDLILHIFGPGEALGAVAVYEGRPYPASAEALEPTSCLMLPRQSLFTLLQESPSLVRGLLSSLTHRLVELTDRLSQLTGARVETRFARLFLKLAAELGRPERGGTFVAMALSRQELADLTGTTIETSIRVMSRWGKDDVLRTEKDGFVIVDRAALAALAE